MNITPRNTEFTSSTFKLELLLHIGTNKTGSSFLQTTLAVDNKRLYEQGVYVPDSKWDIRMKKGLITPGNGQRLAQILASEDRMKLKKYLKKLVQSAIIHNANKIILSNEVLIRLFSNAELISILQNAADESSISRIKCICFLRNPYKHALSLYKHRAKYGHHRDYQEWFEADYETFRLFSQFLKHFRHNSIEWYFYLYKKNPNYLLDTFYASFLSVDPPLKTPKISVNPSLTLNHIKLLQWQEQLHHGIAPYLYRSLINQEPISNENIFLENEFMAAAQAYFKNYKLTILELSRLISSDKHRKCFLEKKIPDVSGDKFISISKKEMESVEIAWQKYSGNKYGRFFKRIIKFFFKVFTRPQTRFDRKRYGGSLY